MMKNNSSFWQETVDELVTINRQFIFFHDIGEKNWTASQKEEVKNLRARCVKLGEIRYNLAKGVYDEFHN